MRSLLNPKRKLGLLSDEAAAEERVREEAARRAEAGADGDEEIIVEEPAIDSLESELIDLQDVEDEGENHEEEVAEAIEVAEALESLVIRMTVSLESGGLNRSAAAFATDHADYLLSKVGMNVAANRVMPGLESFGGSGNQLGATRLAIESLGEKVKELWAKVLAAIQKAREWVIGYLNKIFGAAEKLQSRANSVKAAAEALGDAKPAGSKIDREGLVEAVSYKGKPNVEGLSAIEGVAKAFNDEWTKVIEQGSADIAQYIENADKEGAKLKKGVLTNFNWSNINGKEVSDENGFLEIESEELPGGVMIKAKVAKELDAVSQADQKVELVKADGKATGELHVLSKDEMVRVANDCLAVANIMLEFKKAQAKSDKATKDLLAAAKTAANGAKTVGSADEQLNASLKASAKLASNAVNLLEGVPARFYSYGCGAARAYLDWAQLSLKEYKGGEKKPEEKAA